jgi:hypothetical protein
VDIVGVHSIDEKTHVLFCTQVKLTGGTSADALRRGDIEKIAARVPFLNAWVDAEITKKQIVRLKAQETAKKAMLQQPPITQAKVDTDSSVPASVNAETTDDEIRKMVENEREAMISAIRASYGLSQDAQLIPVLLVVTNRALGPRVTKETLSILTPPDGGAAVLTRDEMASHWPSPVRVLAHDLKQTAYGPPINDQELRILRRAALSLPESIAKLLSEDALTDSERAIAEERAKAERRAEEIEQSKVTAELQAAKQMAEVERLTPLLAKAELEHFAAALAKEGVSAFAMKTSNHETRQELIRAAQAAGLNRIDVTLFAGLLGADTSRTGK